MRQIKLKNFKNTWQRQQRKNAHKKWQRIRKRG